MYCVYAIGRKEDLVEPYDNCYIGVTNDTFRRWKAHSCSRFTVGRYIRDNDLVFENNMIILHQGDEEVCFEMEEFFRPVQYMGLNEASGGHGGRTTYSEERNLKISQALKGKIKSKEHIKKMMANREKLFADKNPNAKKWKLVDPFGDNYIIEGTLTNFCNQKQILESCLRRYLGKKVEEPNASGYGGFRAKNEKSRVLRENTTGWSLERI